MKQLPGAAGESILCVGTSPAMLLEGLRHARAGARVTFLDRATAIGGGWRTRALFDFDGVEVGAHLFENRRAVNESLRSVLAEDELVVDEAGFGLVGRRRIPLRAARGLPYAGLTAKALARLDPGRLAHSARNLLAAAASYQLPLLYPKGGVAVLLTHLHDLLHSAGAAFHWGVELEQVEVGQRAVSAQGTGFSMAVHRVIMSSRAHAPVAGCNEVFERTRTVHVDSLVLLVEEDRIDFDGYVELFSNPVIKRVRRLDLSSAVRKRPLLVVQVREMQAEINETVHCVIKEAVRLGLLHSHLEPERVHHERVSYRTLPSRGLDRLAIFGEGRITMLDTVDFSDPPRANRQRGLPADRLLGRT